MKVGLRLTISHVCLAVLSVLATGGLIGYFAVMRGTEPILDDSARRTQACVKSHLVAIRDLKAQEVKSLFHGAARDVDVLLVQVKSRLKGELPIYEALAGPLSEPFKPPAGQESWRNDVFSTFLRLNPTYDNLLMVDSKGTVRYSVTSELEGVNVLDDVWEESGLHRAVNKAIKAKDVAYGDASPYPEKLGIPAAFVAKPMVDEDDNLVMVIVLQISNAAVNAIMADRNGLGRTGELLLIGDDFLPRADSVRDSTGLSMKEAFADPDNHVIESKAIQRVFNDGCTGVIREEDYRGRDVFSAFVPVKINDDLTHCLIAKMDVDEAMDGKAALMVKAEGLRNQLIMTLTVAVVVVAVIASILALFLAGSISRPITRLSDAFRKFREHGIVEGPAAKTGVNEIDELAESFIALIQAQKQREELQTQLQQSQKMDAIGQLAGGIAHDFNNLLGGIQGAADLLALRIDGNDEKRKFVDLIIETSQRAADLTGRLLAFSRKDTSFSDTVNMHDVIFAAIAILERTVDKRVTIEQELLATPPIVIGDLGQLQNVIINLGINARDAMPDGGTLSFSTKLVALEKNYCDASPFDLEPGKFIEITVRDSGIGMIPEVQSRIFEPFFTTKEVGKGTGVGLAAVYGTIKEHHGSVSVDSEVDRGTVFKVYLPVGMEIDADETTITDVLAPTGHGCIMVVDDEEVIRITAGSMLRELGYKVVFAANGMEAVEMFSKYADQIDLIVLDLVMPVMDGRDTLKEIWSRAPEMKVIISSGFSKDAATSELIASGKIGFLRKPFRHSELAKAVAGALDSD